MSAHSPQRARKSLGAQGSMFQRENSPSPSSFRERPRTTKAQSMPMVPSAAQIFAASQQQQQQSTPTSPNSNNQRRSPPHSHTGAQIQRALPTPPQPNPNPLPFHDDLLSQERHMSPGPTVANTNTISPIHPRPIPRTGPPQFLSKYQFQDMEEKWQMTDELMAEIERADLDMQAQSQQQQQSQTQAHSHPLPSQEQQSQSSPQVQSLSYPRENRDRESPARDPAVERIRTLGRGGSPKDIVGAGSVAVEGATTGAQPPRRQASIRDRNRGEREGRDAAPGARSSSKGRSNTSFSPTQPQHQRTQTPESYLAHRPHLSLTTQAQTHTPPLQTINTSIANRSTRTPDLPLVSSVRTPDKSLPVQEEDENGQLHEHAHGSPTPSSDLNPDGHSHYPHGGRSSRAGHHPLTHPHDSRGGTNSGRSSRAGHRRSLDNHPKAQPQPKTEELVSLMDDDEDLTLFEKSDKQDEDGDGDEEEVYTPRSAQVGLPDHANERYQHRLSGGHNQPPQTQGRSVQSQSPATAAQATTMSRDRERERERERPRSSDQPRKNDQDQKPQPRPQPSIDISTRQHAQTQNPYVQPHIANAPFHPYAYPHPSMTPDNISLYSHSLNSIDLEHPTSAYIQAYLRSSYENIRNQSNSRPRPDAPIPPTPHSQTNPPSPSPLLSGQFLDEMSTSNGTGSFGGMGLEGLGMEGLEGFDGMGIESSKEYLPPFSPIVPAGSPYPYPFTHVRRAKSYSHQPNPLAKVAASSINGSSNNNAQSNTNGSAAANIDLNNPAAIQEQFARQWQIYAQNLQAQLHAGDITETDSTFSPPSATPSLLPPVGGLGINGHIPFNPWAYWHTQRIMGKSGSMTARSSPSHEPVPLPTPPPMVGVRRKGRSMDLSHQAQALGSSGPGYGNYSIATKGGYVDPVQGLGLSGLAMGMGRGKSTKPAQPHPLRQGRKPPPRVESTQPRETSPEPLGSSSDSGEETAGESQFVDVQEGSWVNGNLPASMNGGRTSSSAGSGTATLASVSATAAPIPLPAVMSIPIVDDSDVSALDGGHSSDWVDEDDDSDEDDLLELEYHPSYVGNVDKRRRRWETRWDALMQAFQALDRQTDTTMVLLAAPSHSSKLHMVTSRSIRRHSDIPNSSSINTIRAGFKQVAVQRRKARALNLKTSLADRFLATYMAGNPLAGTRSGSAGSGSGSGDGAGSDGSSDMSSVRSRREEDLKRALDAALGSLGYLGNLYEEREARWMDEMKKVRDDRERVALLLTQVLGEPEKREVGSGSVSTNEKETSPGVSEMVNGDR